jgi:hypothetical protein
MKARLISGLLVGLLPMVLAGCAGYRLGPTNGVVAGSQSVQIRPFQNSTSEPRLSDAVATALRKQVQQDGTYRLETQGGGDLLVSGVINRYDRTAVSFQPTDIITVRDVKVIMGADVTVIERSTGRTNLHREVTGHTTLRVGNDQTSAERQALPLLAEDLARNITSLLVDGTW